MNAVPLRRNRDFMLLQTGQLLVEHRHAADVIAYPLLVLALTGSAAKAGLVGFVRLLPRALLALPAGLLADRGNRKWLMVGSDAVRVVSVGTLVAAVALDVAGLWLIAAIAFLDGAAPCCSERRIRER